MVKHLLISAGLLLLSACASSGQTAYARLGGMPALYAVTDNFITLIEHEPRILKYFKGVDIAEFRRHFAIQLCMETGGPCEYTGRTMQDAHAMMNITEADFNLTVELLIKACEQAGLATSEINYLLMKLATMRKDMLYK